MKPTAHQAVDYARRTIAYRRLRTNEARRRLGAISDPFWLRLVADMGLSPMIAHRPVNRDRTAFQGWQV